ncbi:MAG: hypothetical protein IIB19_02555 [Chloroflexi bacterium]|nr:hypothetical protein [Chloroflexota bacterium]
MVEERSRRRRRRRRHRGGGGGAGSAAGPEQPQAKATPQLPDWRWRSFPVFFAFACGALAVILLSVVFRADVLFFGALFGVAFGLAHMVTRLFVARRGR